MLVAPTSLRAPGTAPSLAVGTCRPVDLHCDRTGQPSRYDVPGMTHRSVDVDPPPATPPCTAFPSTCALQRVLTTVYIFISFEIVRCVNRVPDTRCRRDFAGTRLSVAGVVVGRPKPGGHVSWDVRGAGSDPVDLPFLVQEAGSLRPGA